MIASPGDVRKERAIVTEELHAWNDVNASSRRLVLLPVKWETHSTPEVGQSPQAIINHHILGEADIVIAVFWTRIGTPTEDYESGTVEEIKRHAAANKIVKVYFSGVDAPLDSLNNEQYEGVRAFKLWCQQNSLFAEYKSHAQFRRDVRRHLELELNKSQYWSLLPAEANPVSRGASNVNFVELSVFPMALVACFQNAPIPDVSVGTFTGARVRIDFLRNDGRILGEVFPATWLYHEQPAIDLEVGKNYYATIAVFNGSKWRARETQTDEGSCGEAAHAVQHYELPTETLIRVVVTLVGDFGVSIAPVKYRLLLLPDGKAEFRVDDE